jgi:hypothetical protein
VTLDQFRFDASGVSSAFFLTSGMHRVLADHVDQLEGFSKLHSTNCRICMFTDSADPLQAMIIVQRRGMDSLPRRLVNKPKLFMPLRGNLVLVRVGDDGDVVSRELLQPGRDLLSCVAPAQVYVDLPLDEMTTHLEITLGPHDRVADRNFPRFTWDRGSESRAAWREQQVALATQPGDVAR